MGMVVSVLVRPSRGGFGILEDYCLLTDWVLEV